MTPLIFTFGFHFSPSLHGTCGVRVQPLTNKCITLLFVHVKWFRSSMAILCVLLPCFILQPTHAENKSAVEPQVLSLPKGPGSIEGLGESFEPQLNTGTAAYRVKLGVPPGINKHQPDLALVYNSGYGNSPLGIGWRLNVPSIQRQTDKGLPLYDSSDTFIHSEAGELVPLTDGNFRLKIEGAFMKFQRNGDGWLVWEKDGTQHYFGTTSAARLQADKGVFEWRLEKSVDTHGNAIVYFYDTDQGQLYLREVRYSLSSTTVYQSVNFLYESRPDAFTDYHSRSRVLTAKRLVTVEMRSQGALVRKYRLAYQASPNLSLISQVAQMGSDGISALPPISFNYSTYAPYQFSLVTMTDPPPVSLANTNTDLIDIDGDSLPDVLYTPPDSGHRFYLNQGRGVWRYEPVLPVNSPVNHLATPGVLMADMNGDGLADLYVKHSSGSGYYRNPGQQIWDQNTWRSFNVNPYFNFDDASTRLLDLNNDKLIDVLHDTGSAYLVWLNPGSQEWNLNYDYITHLPSGSHLRLGDDITRIGDMNGDRIDDFVHVQSGYVSYFPGKGFGDYDDEILMVNAPSGLVNLAAKLELTDLNNDGLSDLVLVGNSTIRVWFNNAKGGFESAYEFNNTPSTVGYSAHRFADMDGDGFRDLLITNEIAIDRYQYVSFNQGTHPNLLTRIDNGLGMATTIEYQSSTVDYLADRDAGKPWAQKLPFPVQVVSRVSVKDSLSGQVYVTDYHYRDGYYDGVEKEFRGFAEVTKLEHGGTDAPGLISVHDFDVGKVYESRKGMSTALALLAETGSLNPLQGVFETAAHDLTTRTLFKGTNGQTVTYSFTSKTTTQLYELGNSPKTLLKEWEQDNYGNLISEFDYGLVDGTNEAAGKDEVLTTTQYQYDLVKWIVNRPSEVRKTDLTGGFVSLQRLFYDDYGSLIRDERSPDGVRFIPAVRNDYDSYGNIIKITDANDYSRSIDYDPIFHALPVKETINGLNLTMQANYDFGLGVMTIFTDPNSQTTLFQYDTFGRLSAIIKPGDSTDYPTQHFSYHLAAPVSYLQTQSREVSGQPGSYDSISYFDGLGRKLQTRSEGKAGQWVVSEAASFNLRRGIQHQWLPYFDAKPDYATPDPAKPFTTFAYDARSRSVRETNPDGSTRATAYQPLEKIQYDEEDTRVGGEHFDTPHYALTDGRNRLVEARERNGTDTYTTRYAYDGLDNLVKITDHEGNIKTLLFDGLGRKTAMDDPDKGAMSYRYDDAGNLLETIDAKQQKLGYAYDAANRIATESQQGNVKVRYHYDMDLPTEALHKTLGRLAWVEDEAGSKAYSYDPRGRIVKQIQNLNGLNFTTSMEYDALDRLTSLGYPDGSRVTYLYNAMNRLDAVPGYVNNIDYTPTGQKAAFQYANGIQSSYAYDVRQRLNRLYTGSNGSVLQDLTYSYDQSSNITRINDQRAVKTPEDRSTDYQYDDLYRLTSATAPAWSEQYQYNPIGNMTYKSDLGAMGYGAGPAGPHALTSVGTAVYGYDGNGNLASKPGFAYQFDPKDRLQRVDRTADGAVVNYAYDYQQQRKRKTVSVSGQSQTTLYVDRFTEVRPGKLVKNIFAGDRLVARVMVQPFNPAILTGGTATLTAADLDINPKDGVISVEEIRAASGSANNLNPSVAADVLRLYQDSHDTQPGLVSFATLALVMHGVDKTSAGSNSQTYFYLPDHLGSASIVTDASGNVAEQSVFYPYGKDRVHLGGFNSEYRFTGKELDDETGLHYFGARYYDSATGRFVSVDPLFINQNYSYKPSGRFSSSYTYGLNSPIIFTDSDGLCAILANNPQQYMLNIKKPDEIPLNGEVSAGAGIGGGERISQTPSGAVYRDTYFVDGMVFNAGASGGIQTNNEPNEGRYFKPILGLEGDVFKMKLGFSLSFTMRLSNEGRISNFGYSYEMMTPLGDLSNGSEGFNYTKEFGPSIGVKGPRIEFGNIIKIKEEAPKPQIHNFEVL